MKVLRDAGFKFKKEKKKGSTCQLCLGNKSKVSVFVCIRGRVGGSVEKPVTITKRTYDSY